MDKAAKRQKKMLKEIERNERRISAQESYLALRNQRRIMQANRKRAR
jgi:hypothetical protein